MKERGELTYNFVTFFQAERGKIDWAKRNLMFALNIQG